MLQGAAGAPASLERRLDVIESRNAVRQLKADYMQWIDDKRGPDVDELFWPDGIWESLPDRTDSPSPGARYAGRVAIRQMMTEARQNLTFTAHYLSNEDIDVDGDRAVGRWKLLQPCIFRGETAFWQGGCYTDDFERRDGTWRFAHLRLAMDFRSPYEDGWLKSRMRETP